MHKLHVLNGPEMGQSFELKDGLNYVGRSEDNDIQINDKTVSRRHLKIVLRDNRIFVTDLKSENGTFIGGDIVVTGLEVEVEEGEILTIGMCMICLGRRPVAEMMPFLKPIGFTDEAFEILIDFAAYRDQTNHRRRAFLSKVSEIIEGNLPLKEALRGILENIFVLLKRIDRVAFVLIDPDTQEILDVVSSSKQATSDTYCLEVVKRVIEDRRVVAVSNVQTEEQDELVDTLKILKIESVMCVPMFSRSRLIGLIYVDSLGRPYGFRKEDLPLFTDLSQMTAVAVEKAQLSAKSTGRPDNLPLDS
ncbi:MAG: FHA domain-containing protein [Deltaproteobacteria bacterium]|nr:FHA domain-containing protein [Deltaproteobacteria bacterium]